MNLYSKYANKLKSIASKSIMKKNYELAMAAISSYCSLSYEWNQFYMDEEMEHNVHILEKHIIGTDIEKKAHYQKHTEIILFYDGFGLDTRGLAIIYAKAIIQLGYKVIWVTRKSAKGKIIEIEKLLSTGDSKIVFLDDNSTYINHIRSLSVAFENNMPSKAFLYTKPNDVSAMIVFSHYADVVKRFQINLTDHAFWLGVSAFDICIEFREYGARISSKYRGIPKDRIRILPYYPWVGNENDFKGFPFETSNKKILFSGGALYKTIGRENKFYKIVNNVLLSNDNLIFLYAGNGDDSELKKLARKYPNRVFHIEERKDLFALMENIDVYLNTYPILGGLMTQYAALAKKVPLILSDLDCDESNDILMDQRNTDIEFHSLDEICDEISKLLRNDEYRKIRGNEIVKHVNTEDAFKKMLNDILKLDEKASFLEYPTVGGFCKDYAERFNMHSVIYAIASKKNMILLKYFPYVFIKGLYLKLNSVCQIVRHNISNHILGG